MSQVERARRELFEAKMHEALVAEGYNAGSVPSVIERSSDGSYRSVRIAGAWLGFNAALDALVIELKPPHNDYSYTDSEAGGAAKYYDQCIQTIKSIGLGVKVK